MLPTKLLRRFGRRVATRVANRVSRNELFEQHGERSRQSPLEPMPAAEPVVEEPPVEEPAPKTAVAEEPAAEPAGGLSGCVPMDAAEVKALLGPADRVRVVNHWATWCDPCIEELPHLVALHARLGDRVSFLGISWDLFEGGQIQPTAVKVEAFSEGQKLTWGSALVTSPPPAFFAALDIDWQRIPQTWIIQPDGTISRRIEGLVDEALVEELVAELSA